LLRAVAVVHVPVDDQYPLALVDQCRGRDGDVVQQAKAHRPVRQGVVSGGTHRDEANTVAATLQFLDDRETGPGGELSD
jgi:hypothetical protein